MREREWEASHTVWIWFDRSPSMAFASELAPCPKVDRAAVLALALAELAVRGGERAGLIGLTPPLASRDVIERFAEAIAADETLHGASTATCRRSTPMQARARSVGADRRLPHRRGEDVARGDPRTLAASGAEGQLLMIADPIEETFPFPATPNSSPRSAPARLRAPRAQSLRDAYLERLAAHREAVRAACAARGWGFALHRTDQSAAQALLPCAPASPAPSRRRPAGAPRMLGLPLAFAAPAALAALALLAALYLFLQITPPRPREAVFPPLRLLLGLDAKDATPAKTPWPLLALRIAIAALVILAMAGPMWNALQAGTETRARCSC